MKRIAVNFKGLYKEIILGPLFKFLEAVLELFVPLLMANIIDVGIRNGDTGYIITRGLLMLLLGGLGVAMAMICQYYAAVAAGSFGLKLRSQLYHHIMRFSTDEVEKYGSSGLITRLTNDTNQIQNGINMTIRLGSRAPFLAIGSIVMALYLNWRIGLIFLITTPIVIFVLYLIMKKTLPRYREIQMGQDNLARLSGEHLDGVRIIRAFSRQEQEQAEFEQSASRLTKLMISVGKVSAALNPLTSAIINLSIVMIIWLGSKFAFEGNILSGEIIALVNYMNQTLLALIVAANLIVFFTRAVASTKRVAEVLDTEPSIQDGTGVKIQTVTSDPTFAEHEKTENEKIMENKNVIEFEDVEFSYHSGGQPALSGMRFTVYEGQTIGIIGGTGSGKTTLVKLLLRYFDPSSGRILLFGSDLKDYKLHSLREKIGIVPQKAALLSGSIRHNMQIGKSDATDEEIWYALEVAQAADFVREKPNGLDAPIDEGGKNLSGGQRQRLTIARAIVKTPQILILDDSASALDYATDAALRRAIRKHAMLMRSDIKMTTVMISQRASTIKNADQILVLDNGALVGSGNHNTLLDHCEVYREICESQGILPISEGGKPS